MTIPQKELDEQTKTACSILGVSPIALWNKAARPIIASGKFAPQEALRIVKAGTLSKNEIALLITAGVELLQKKSEKLAL
jgi:hypothetical protein